MKHLFFAIFAMLFLAGAMTLPPAAAVAHEAGQPHGMIIAEPEQSGPAVPGIVRESGHRHDHGTPSSSDQCTLGAFCVPFVALAAAEAPVGVQGGQDCDAGRPPASLHGLTPDRDPPVPRA